MSIKDRFSWEKETWTWWFLYKKEEDINEYESETREYWVCLWSFKIFRDLWRYLKRK